MCESEQRGSAEYRPDCSSSSLALNVFDFSEIGAVLIVVILVDVLSSGGFGYVLLEAYTV